jgi:oxepin-CoA hydrolase/3-oxo-5,6-dehydrosuberyl-CoA semialdehyde dehydrogenase
MQELSLSRVNDFFEQDLDGLLRRLRPDMQPHWGRLTPQHMVEHLTWAIDGALGRWPATVVTPPDKLPKLLPFLYSNLAMRHHFQHPQMPVGELPALRTGSLHEAVTEFWERWGEFQRHCEANPGTRSDHVVFGNLNEEEWRRLHFKHVVHHLSQFGLTTVEAHGLVMPPPPRPAA